MPAVTLLVACATTTDRSFATRVTLEGIRPAAQAEQLTLLLSLQNLSGSVMRIAGLDYRLELNDAEFAWGSSRQSVSVPAMGEAVFPVSVPGRLPLNDNGGGGSRDALVYNLSGVIYLADDRGRLPFVEEGSLNWREGVNP